MTATRVPAPRAPETAPPYRFPLLASLAPVIASVAMWLITSSPFALMFAALGPVTALASLADVKLGARRSARREAHRFDADVLAARREIAARHSRERAEMREATPLATTIAESTAPHSGRWAGDAAASILVTLGTGAAASALEFDRPALGSAGSAAAERAYGELAALAGELVDAPIRVDARLGIGICGPPAVAAGVARAIAVQLAWSLSPAVHAWSGGAGSEEWLAVLPHERGRAPSHPAVWVQFGSPEPVVSVSVAERESDLPGSCRVVVRVGDTAAVSRHPDAGLRRDLAPGVVSREQALGWALTAARDAARDGLARSTAALPAAVELTPLLRPDDDHAGRSLAAEVAVDTTGAVTLDLVAHGPHAVIGGTTGSGKSELLIAWVLAMAAAHPPERVTFLLIDFKGGSAFAALDALPHTVGIVTDLDAIEAARALQSLTAELRHRERVIAQAGARDIDGIEGLPRLVVIVDEFAAMLADHPALHALFADLAARGRSLGVHLVLCTQRPSGVVRDAVLANADLRVSLRVNNRADSSAVVGSDAAAAIPASARGRGILSLAGSPPTTVQFALASTGDVVLVASRWPASPPPRRPWCPPLPADVPRQAARRGGIAFGLLDLPREQRRDAAEWLPHDHGNVLVLGAAGSGKSWALEAIGGELVASDPACAWDAVDDLVRALDRQNDRVVLLDDLDALLPRFGGEYAAAFEERLARVLREGPARGIRVVAAAQRLTAHVQQLAPLLPARLLLRHANRQELVLAGGDGDSFTSALPPGGGLWFGDRVQVSRVESPSRLTPSPRESAVRAAPLAIITPRVAALTATAMAAGCTVVDLAVADPNSLTPTTAVIGDIDEWQSRWGAVAALRPVAEILLDGCSTADFRALTRQRELPPPLSPGLCWRLDPDGGVSRARLPWT